MLNADEVIMERQLVQAIVPWQAGTAASLPSDDRHSPAVTLTIEMWMDPWP